MSITIAESDADIATTFPVMQQLRPHLALAQYLPMVRAMMTGEGYRLAVLRAGDSVTAVAGYRVMTMLYAGRILYVDDLVTDETSRSRGHGAEMLTWLKAEGRRQGCKEVQLISHVRRERAHRFYFREGMGIECFHFRAAL
jgi:GNAT superfamily N-acetyltransferase